MSEDNEAFWGPMAASFMAGVLATMILFILLDGREITNARHILSHIPKGHILKAKDQIASEKTKGSESERELSHGTNFDVREVKP